MIYLIPLQLQLNEFFHDCYNLLIEILITSYYVRVDNSDLNFVREYFDDFALFCSD